MRQIVISPVPVPPRPAAADPATPASTTPAPTAPAPSAAAQASGTADSATPVGRANPTFQFDPAAGVVVIQFRDDSGKVALSIPSQQQINAYATDRVEGQKPASNALIA